MRLLVITQKVDKADPILGFFHSWLIKLSEKFQEISVICLEKGEYDLPQNVTIFSLGKESGRSKIKYVKNFLNLILGLHNKYDAVFVHMNQEYILLGGFLWKILRKKVYFWRNHKDGNLLTKIAVWLSNKVFCTSKDAFVAKYKKTKLMPVGINTEMFKVVSSKQLVVRGNKILFLSRMSPIKRPDLLIEVLNILNKDSIDFVCDFYGDALPKDEQYFRSIKENTKKLGLENKVKFYKSVPNCQTPKIYNDHEIFVNLTPSGSFDKTILEAAACGCIPIITNKSLAGEIDERLIAEENIKDIASKIKHWLKAEIVTKEEINNRLKQYVDKNHSLSLLVDRLYKEIRK